MIFLREGNQEKFETELSELRGRLKSIGESSAGQETQLLVEESNNEQINSETQAINEGLLSGNQSARTVDQLNEIISEELKSFCERVLLNQNSLSRVNCEQHEFDQKASGNESSENAIEYNEESGMFRHENTIGNLTFEMEVLKERLLEVLQPYLSSVSTKGKLNLSDNFKF